MRNNKGFMLAEVVIVSTIVTSVIVSLYTGFNRVYKFYNERSHYYDIDGLYALKTISDLLLEEEKLNGYHYLPTNGVIDDNYFTNKDLISNLKTNYNIQNIYFKSCQATGFPSDINPTMEDYINNFLNGNFKVKCHIRLTIVVN